MMVDLGFLAHHLHEVRPPGELDLASLVMIYIKFSVLL
jgi:hypothetical protein